MPTYEKSVALVVTTYNRYRYLKKFLEQLRTTQFPKHSSIIIVDDASSDKRVLNAIHELSIKNVKIKKILNTKRTEGINEHCLLMGLQKAIATPSTHFCIVDPDTLLAPTWLEMLHSFDESKLHSDYILSAYCSHAHEIKSEHKTYNEVKSLGGVNMYFNKRTLEKHVMPSLKYEWDWRVCASILRAKGQLCTLKESYIQHQGSFGSFSKGPLWYDFSENFIENGKIKKTLLKSLAFFKRRFFSDRLFAGREILKKYE